MKPYTLGEWQLILWAYAYEFEDDPIADDRSFDRIAAALQQPSSLPDFNPSTGQWVHDVVAELGEDFLKAATAKLRKIGKGASVVHINFPKGWLVAPPWELPHTYDHIKP